MIKVPASSRSFDFRYLDHNFIVNRIVEGEFILDINHKTIITFAASIAIRHSKRNFLSPRGLVINFTLDTSFCMTVDNVSTKAYMYFYC